MKIYASIFLTILIFFSFATPVAPSERKAMTKEEEIGYLRADNLVLLRLINFKTRYGSYEEYYRQADSSLPE